MAAGHRWHIRPGLACRRCRPGSCAGPRQTGAARIAGRCVALHRGHTPHSGHVARRRGSPRLAGRGSGREGDRGQPAFTYRRHAEVRRKERDRGRGRDLRQSVSGFPKVPAPANVRPVVGAPGLVVGRWPADDRRGVWLQGKPPTGPRVPAMLGSPTNGRASGPAWHPKLAPATCEYPVAFRPDTVIRQGRIPAPCGCRRLPPGSPPRPL